MFDDNLVTNVLNSSYMKRWTQLDTAHEGRFVQWYSTQLESNVDEYSWPRDMLRVMKVEYVSEDGTKTPLRRNERHYGNINPDTSFPDAAPYTYKPVKGGYLLEPRPQSGAGSIRVEFVKMPDSLANDADEIDADFPEIFGELIVLDAVVALIDSEGQLEDGSAKAVLRQREEWDREWRRYINRLVTSANEIVQWNPHYDNA